MAGFVFNQGAYGLQHNDILWTTDTIKARLSLTSESSLNKDTTAMTGLGLTATDVTLGTMAGPTKDDTNDRVKYSSANVTFAAVAAGAEVNKMIVFKFVTNDAGSTPIAVVEMSPARTPNGGDITLTISADGMFYTQE